MSAPSDLRQLVRDYNELTELFAVPVGPTPIPWHHQRRSDHALLIHRTGPDFHRAGSFITWARRQASEPDALLRIETVHGAERLRLAVPASLALIRYDRGQIEIRVYDSVFAYLRARRSRLPRTR